MNVFVFRPGGVQSGNVFTDWTTLVDALATIEGRKIIEFDDSIVGVRVSFRPYRWGGRHGR